MNYDAIERLVTEDGVPAEQVHMAVTLAKIAGAALERESALLREQGAADGEVDDHFERRRHELNDWLNATLKKGIAAMADDAG